MQFLIALALLHYEHLFLYLSLFNIIGKINLVSGVLRPDGIALDAVNRKLYWTDRWKKVVEMSELDGSQRKAIITNHLYMPFDIAVDPQNRSVCIGVRDCVKKVWDQGTREYGIMNEIVRNHEHEQESKES